MALDPKQEAIRLLEESLKELDSPKGSISSGIRKLKQAYLLIDETEMIVWCDLQLGKPKHQKLLKKFILYINSGRSRRNSEFKDMIEELKQEGIHGLRNLSIEDYDYMSDESSGGIAGIGFIEERYNDLDRTRKDNDGTYCKLSLGERLNYIRNLANEKAAILLHKLAFTDTTKTAFDYLKEEVDDKLLDLNPKLAEKLMAIFKSASSDNTEEWSQALTSCRRIIEKLADELFPPIKEQVNGRKLGQTQYINRLWAFMDKAIESKSNKEIAKAHVDILGIYIQSNHKLTNKGVHAEVTKVEAVKTVFHTYLMIADILPYMNLDPIE